MPTLGPGQAVPLPDGPLEARLTWTRTETPLELYALWNDRQGRTGATYWRQQGATDQAPFVTHVEDSRQEQHLTFADPTALRHALVVVFAPPEAGMKVWLKAGIHLAVGGVDVPLADPPKKGQWAVLAALDWEAGRLTGVMAYGEKRREESPVLWEDGSFTLDAGVVESKFEWSSMGGGLPSIDPARTTKHSLVDTAGPRPSTPPPAGAEVHRVG